MEGGEGGRGGRGGGGGGGSAVMEGVVTKVTTGGESYPLFLALSKCLFSSSPTIHYLNFQWPDNGIFNSVS